MTTCQLFHWFTAEFPIQYIVMGRANLWYGECGFTHVRFSYLPIKYSVVTFCFYVKYIDLLCSRGNFLEAIVTIKLLYRNVIDSHNLFEREDSINKMLVINILWTDFRYRGYIKSNSFVLTLLDALLHYLKVFLLVIYGNYCTKFSIFGKMLLSLVYIGVSDNVCYKFYCF